MDQPSLRIKVIATVAIAVVAVVWTVLMLRETWAVAPSAEGVLGSKPAESVLPQLPEPAPTELQLPAPQEPPPPALAPEPDAVDVFGQIRRSLIDAFPPHDVLVQVVDAHGRPVGDATIEVWPSMDGPGPNNTSHITDAEGNARLVGVAGGAVLFASKKGVGTSGRFDTGGNAVDRAFTSDRRPDGTVDLGLGATQSIVLTLRPVGHLTGRVLSARGQPLPGAEVSFCSDVTLDPIDGAVSRLPRPSLTDAEGHFDIEVDAPFFADGVATFAGEQTPSSIFSVDPGDRDEEDLRFPGGYWVAGRIIYGLEPPPRLDIRVHAIHTEEGQHTSAVAADDGEYRVDLSKPGDYALYARAPGMIESAPVIVRVDDEHVSAQRDLRVVETTSISGRVVDELGKPVASFNAEASGEDSVTGRTMQDDVIDDAYLMDIKYGSDGSFKLEPVSSERDYSVYLNGQYEDRLRHVRGGTQDVVLVQRDRNKVFATVRGTVTDAETGAPVTHFKLEVPGATVQDFNDLQGGYELKDLRVDNEWTITVSALGFESLAAEPIWLQPGDTTVDFRLGQPGGLMIAVTNAAGQPAAGAAVDWFPVGSVGLYSQAGTLHAVASEEGIAEFQDVDPGDGWLLAALGQEHAGPMRVAVPAGRNGTASVRLASTQQTGRIDVEIANAQAETLQGLVVVLVVSQRVSEALRWGHEMQTLPLPDGTATFNDVAPGLYAVCLRHAPDDERYRRVVVEPGGRLRVRLKAP
ncbi:MAG TPA: carboxypeptidase-like regulatory domain-containing protein [Planctomycetota bacterium]|nr:carboxypeptidase-like regulatory domain-containing protein [Planctomycetota bacterium]